MRVSEQRKLVKQMIAESGLTPAAAIRAVGMVRSSYYYRPQPLRGPRPLDPGLSAAIVQVLVGPAMVYGYRKVQAALVAQDQVVNHKKVLRHTHGLGLTQPRKVKGRGYTHPVPVQPTQSNTYWEEDLTYVWCGSQPGYLFALIDGCDKEIAGDTFGDRCRADETSMVLEQAVFARFGSRVPVGHRVVLRIDRGSAFKARKFRATAHRLGVELEYAGIRCPNDKPYIEAFFSKYKVEEVYRHEYRDLVEGKMGWELYRSWHNNERVHQTLNYRTPRQARAGQMTALANEVKMCNINQAPLCPK